MSTLRMLRTPFSVLALWLAGLGLALAQPNSIDALNVSQEGGKILVTVTTHSPLTSAPPSFSVTNPARIAVDFPETVNGTGRTTQNVGQGDLESMNLVQGAGRTRLVLNLTSPVAHDVSVSGNNVVISLSPTAVTTAAAAATAPVAHFAEGRADMTHSIRNVDFRRGASGEGRVVVDLSDSNTGIDIRKQGLNIVVEFLKTSVPAALRRRLDVTDFGTPVQTISTYQQGENVRMIITPKGNWEQSAYQTENEFVVEVKPAVKEAAAGVLQTGKYTGEKLSLNFQNVSVRAVLNVIADFTNLNIITSDTVTGNITLRLKDVPWDQALAIILETRGLDMRRNGNVIWIAPREEIATREKLALEAQQQLSDLEPTQTEAFQLNYQKADDVQKLLTNPQQRMLSKRGSAVVDARTNTLFVQDTPSRLEEVRKLIAKIDVAVRQVMISSRIVEANDTFSRNLGVRLGYNETAGGTHPFFGAGQGVTVGATIDNTGFTTGQTTTAPQFPVGQLNANLPAAGLNSFNAGQFAFTLFNSAMTRFLNLELSALEADGKGKIISSPRVLTADQVEAIIEQGTQIPYQQATSSGATAVAFQNATLSLKVKPQITPDGNVIMNLDVNDNSPGTVTPSGVQINTKHVQTQVLVENGGTVVIGGIYQEQNQTDVTKIPFFGDLPYVGFLFKNNTTSFSKTELLVFITPRIVSDRLDVR
jgi:type IV pilus assembly protein PilQ